jgi:hypothetical protein
MITKILRITSLIILLGLISCNGIPGISNSTGISLEPVKPIPTPVTLDQSANFRDDLSKDISKDWGLKIISGLEKQLIWSQQSGHLRFELLKGNDTNFVFLNKNKKYQDVIVQAEIKPMESTSAFTSVICRASDKGWYEFRINSMGHYQLLKFDQYLKDENKNAYTDLIGGQFRSPLVKTGTEANLLAISCVGKEIKAFINNSQIIKDRRPLVVNDSTYSDGTFGFGISSNGFSTDISFNSIETLKP